MSRPFIPLLRASHHYRPCLAKHLRTPPVIPKRPQRLDNSTCRAVSGISSPAGTTENKAERIARIHRFSKDLNQVYPRLEGGQRRRLTPREFRTRFEDESVANNLNSHDSSENRRDIFEVFGRIQSIRDSSSKLFFVDILRQDGGVQAMFDKNKLFSSELVEFRRARRPLRPGDWINVTGKPTRTRNGQLTISATQLPQLLSVSLNEIPAKLEDKETMSNYPHMQSLVHRQAPDLLRLRHVVKKGMVDYFSDAGFIEVNTPILELTAGGAIARPFETTSNNISDTTINLRIAPELSLKRLIVGGQEKIFELGPVFRNEGVDSTHNPEFLMCEFYEVGARLAELMKRTEDLFERIQHAVTEGFPASEEAGQTPWPQIDLGRPYKELDFFETVEHALGRPLPILQDSDDAFGELEAFLSECGISTEGRSTVPQLLELLAEKYIEPQCSGPTWIMHHPESLSPLAKSFTCRRSRQRVAARAELFINGREIVNCYEEENSPFEQRRKFEEQIRLRSRGGLHDPDGPPPSVDHAYIEALEWGMPPTGGWGCGFDRLVMLFSGQSRIADVLPLGTLKNVVARAQLLNNHQGLDRRKKHVHGVE